MLCGDVDWTGSGRGPVVVLLGKRQDFFGLHKWREFSEQQSNYELLKNLLHEIIYGMKVVTNVQLTEQTMSVGASAT